MVFGAGDAGHAAYLVVRGGVEIVFPGALLERRITVAGPGELVGYRAVLERTVHYTSARVREPACVLELGAVQFMRHYEGTSATTVRLQRAIHRSLLQALARTNAQLTRLICHARLDAADGAAQDLEQALHSQIVLSYN
jgi:CRP-like cAMP-binding protein